MDRIALCPCVHMKQLRDREVKVYGQSQCNDDEDVTVWNVMEIQICGPSSMKTNDDSYTSTSAELQGRRSMFPVSQGNYNQNIHLCCDHPHTPMRRSVSHSTEKQKMPYPVSVSSCLWMVLQSSRVCAFQSRSHDNRFQPAIQSVLCGFRMWSEHKNDSHVLLNENITD